MSLIHSTFFSVSIFLQGISSFFHAVQDDATLLVIFEYNILYYILIIRQLTCN